MEIHSSQEKISSTNSSSYKNHLALFLLSFINASSKIKGFLVWSSLKSIIWINYRKNTLGKYALRVWVSWKIFWRWILRREWAQMKHYNTLSLNLRDKEAQYKTHKCKTLGRIYTHQQQTERGRLTSSQPFLRESQNMVKFTISETKTSKQWLKSINPQITAKQLILTPNQWAKPTRSIHTIRRWAYKNTTTKISWWRRRQKDSSLTQEMINWAHTETFQRKAHRSVQWVQTSSCPSSCTRTMVQGTRQLANTTTR